ncbi:hypothetical protein CDAR_595231 [Caerostris darwini]|uniref:Uncharacterized protein n=1 Tax=Caerostris darwini TaxID=1538125 RepID=A0AAV4PAG0_9ARAC|nr:hypothetical protein CDAR_595231 [Caerostris darwini]
MPRVLAFYSLNISSNLLANIPTISKCLFEERLFALRRHLIMMLRENGIKERENWGPFIRDNPLSKTAGLATQSAGLANDGALPH